MTSLVLGNGAVLFIDNTQTGPHLTKAFEWNDGLFDVTWSENNEHIAVTGSGDGGLQVWDVAKPKVLSLDVFF